MVPSVKTRFCIHMVEGEEQPCGIRSPIKAPNGWLCVNHQVLLDPKSYSKPKTQGEADADVVEGILDREFKAISLGRRLEVRITPPSRATIVYLERK